MISSFNQLHAAFTSHEIGGFTHQRPQLGGHDSFVLMLGQGRLWPRPDHYRPRLGNILVFAGCVVLAVAATLGLGLPWPAALAAASIQHTRRSGAGSSQLSAAYSRPSPGRIGASSRRARPR